MLRSRLSPVPPVASATEIGAMPIERSRPATAPSLGASMVPLTTLPVPSRPL